MGWDVSNISRSISTKNWLKFDIERSISERYELVALGEGKNNHGTKPFYASFRNKENGKVFAVVYMTKRRNGFISVKDVGEDAGPFYFDCPKKVFETLTPTESIWANEWRAKVAQELESAKVPA